MLNNLKKEIISLKNPDKAKVLQKFFKTGKGQYGEGDIFYGLMVPVSRKLVEKYYKDLSFEDIKNLLKSKIHEERLIGTFVLVKKFEKGNIEEKRGIYEFYLKNTSCINNWDLVDLSAPKIVGNYLLYNKNQKDILYQISKSDILWERRIAILATVAFIKEKDFEDILKLSELLLDDKHDLIHKAIGWMLREVGKKDEKVLVDFLDKNIKKMPRTMLRYAIEKFSPEVRKCYLSL